MTAAPLAAAGTPMVRRFRRRASPGAVGLALAAPTLCIFAGLVAIPVASVVVTSFTSWTGFDISGIGWLGIENYAGLLTDPIFLKAFANTLIFTVATTVLLNAVGLGLALLVNTRAHGTAFLKAVLFLPVLLSPVIVGLMWSGLLRGVGGGLNQLLGFLGLIHQPVFWLGDGRFALAAVIIATVWQFAGYDMILYYAGLQNVPDTLLEAAELDGARAWEKFLHVVLPALYHVMSVVALLNVIGGLRIFDIVYVMTRGGPSRSTEVLATYMYEQGFQLNAMGVASALAVVLIVLAIGASALRLRVLRHV
ncbi:MAG: sugar ABC transporter permease [Devosia nanyangense]|uniref:Sugar ABC transporter permease n=1 Tax=Devosia nanyangense TaxID=1228055 RepID=A0A933L426_9HYPH|nr:sugar ABC transporter permease [Devosia nanyangense]